MTATDRQGIHNSRWGHILEPEVAMTPQKKVMIPLSGEKVDNFPRRPQQTLSAWSLKRCPVSPVLKREAGEISNEVSSGTCPQRDDTEYLMGRVWRKVTPRKVFVES